MPKLRLQELVSEAVVDAYDEEEQRGGFHAMLEEHVRLPFEAEVLGVTVSVRAILLTEDEQIVAVCHRGRIRQSISLLNLPLPEPAPEGAEWIEAYRFWARGMR
jgi:hypothetical protein